MSENETGIRISDGRRHLALIPAGPAQVGWPTRIELRSGPFSAAIEAEMMFAQFRDSLAILHKSLHGEAFLACLDDEHFVKITPTKRGQMKLTAEITDGRPPAAARLIVTNEYRSIVSAGNYGRDWAVLSVNWPLKFLE
jgi:hypothetical protein